MVYLKISKGVIIQTRMAFAIKSILVLFMIIGVAIALYGAWEIMGTLNFVNASPGRANKISMTRLQS
jgi:hypothetical protein